MDFFKCPCHAVLVIRLCACKQVDKKTNKAKGDYYREKHPKDKSDKGNSYRPGRYTKIEGHMAKDDVEEWHSELAKIVEACREEAGPQKPSAQTVDNV